MTKSALALFVMTILFSSVLVACGEQGVPEQPPGTSTFAPCVTATPAADGGASPLTAIATPAGSTTPAGGPEDTQATTSPSELATREALLEQQNRPVQVPSVDQTAATSLPVCPTPIPER